MENYGIPHTKPFTIHEGFHFVMQQWLFALGIWKIYEIGQMQGMILFNWMMGGLLLFGYYRITDFYIYPMVMTLLFPGYLPSLFRFFCLFISASVRRLLPFLFS